MSLEMDRLENSVKSITSAKDAAITLVKGLAQRVRDTAGDTTRALALADELDKDANDLGTAVVENTVP